MVGHVPLTTAEHGAESKARLGALRLRRSQSRRCAVASVLPQHPVMDFQMVDVWLLKMSGLFCHSFVSSRRNRSTDSW